MVARLANGRLHLLRLPVLSGMLGNVTAANPRATIRTPESYRVSPLERKLMYVAFPLSLTSLY
jgi:hypothetical protein